MGSEQQKSLKSFVKVFEEASGNTRNVTLSERPYRSREVMTPWSSRNQLPFWRPEIDLKTGIQGFLGA